MANIFEQSRYDRQERITWWDQARLQNSRVLVVGAGALGNEIVKNLALVGVGHITIVDMDIIEHTNLSRCVFFRSGDEGKYKAEVLSARASEINPDISSEYFTVPVQHLGDVFISKYDLVIAGLDNREARVWLGAALRRMNKNWIDGAIEGLMGKVQIFTPEGPCYACGMNDKDWELLAKRKSCTLLGKEEILGGHTPTNATTSSIIAGIEVQEAIKYLVGRPDLVALENKIWRFIGDQMASFISNVESDEFCPYHEAQLEVERAETLPENLGELWSLFGLSRDAVISFPDDALRIERCQTCSSEVKFGYSDLMRGEGACGTCGNELEVNLGKRIEFSPSIENEKISKEFWPVEFAIDIQTDASSFRVALRKEASHG